VKGSWGSLSDQTAQPAIYWTGRRKTSVKFFQCSLPNQSTNKEVRGLKKKIRVACSMNKSLSGNMTRSKAYRKYLFADTVKSNVRFADAINSNVTDLSRKPRPTMKIKLLHAFDSLFTFPSGWRARDQSLPPPGASLMGQVSGSSTKTGGRSPNIDPASR
jgi:hypothetical protein